MKPVKMKQLLNVVHSRVAPIEEAEGSCRRKMCKRKACQSNA